KWAQKGIDGGVDGLIAVNSRAGGHAGTRSPEALFEELAPLGKPIVSAGGVGTPDEFARHLRLGYAAVQLGTRFIATPECKASDAYKQAIVEASEDDIVLTERLTGVPVAVIRNAYVERLGTKAGRFARWMLKGRKTKHWMRTWYALRSIRRLKKSLMTDDTSGEYWQAGKSVAGIHEVKPAAEIVREFAAALD
ncbi:MAG TPA: nitronate monooxygenase, partial [Steroidobacteraceae bacterium]|nr:nitronate monooxygenase [Steroidobacteraceae bacterium]